MLDLLVREQTIKAANHHDAFDCLADIFQYQTGALGLGLLIGFNEGAQARRVDVADLRQINAQLVRSLQGTQQPTTNFVMTIHVYHAIKCDSNHAVSLGKAKPSVVTVLRSVG